MLLRPVLRSVLRPVLRSPFVRSATAFAVAALFAAGEPGVHYETYNPDSLLQRRNLLTWTEDGTNAAWVGATRTAANGFTDPLGGTSAIRVTATGANATFYQALTARGQNGINSLYVRRVTGTGPVTLYSPDGSTSAPIALTGAWQLFTSAATASGASFFGAYLQIATSGDAIEVAFPQAEIGSSRSTYQKVTDWNTEYLAAAGSNVHLWQDNLRTVPVTAVEQTVGAWDDLSGNGKHATQATGSSRPKLSARYNLLTKTEQFSDGVWSKSGVGTPTVTADAAVAPNGTLTADQYNCQPGASHQLYQNPAAAAASYRYGCYVKRKTSPCVALSIYNLNVAAYFDLTQGVVASKSVATAAANMVDVGGGWYWCYIDFTGAVQEAHIDFLDAVVATGANVPWTIATASATDGYMWGADLRLANDAALNIPAYQRVNTTTDYDTTGFIHYLKFDGIDDSFQTPAVDFSACSNMTAWTGVTKLSDSAAAILLETSANATLNSGNFYMGAPGAAAANFSVYELGTGSAEQITYTPFAAPYTAVLVPQLALVAANSAAAIQTRINGALNAGASTLSGVSTGNFASSVLNIGRRNNTSAPYNGRMTSLTVRGSTTPASTAFIKSMEQYAAKLAGQTFAST